ncbi:MAG: amidohydrolase family protein [Desulfovibrionaceae bacterium]
MPISPKSPAAVAYRVRQCVTLAGEGLARGTDLVRPLNLRDDVVLLAQGGRIRAVENFRSFRAPVGVRVEDLGAVCMLPALVNAHTHVQLSFLERGLEPAGTQRVVWNQGFVPWLRSLIPLLGTPLAPADVKRAVRAMRSCGIICVGDYTSHGVAVVHAALREQGMDGVHFCEWFGFQVPPESVLAERGGAYPAVVRTLLDATPALQEACLAPAGHALYSTHPTLLQRAQRFCRAQGRPFSMHLAESPEEEEALLRGTGPLVDLYAERILPAHWQAPALRPVRAAAHWGLLGPDTLAVHGVHCNAADARVLAESGTALCLCPRSNALLAVGDAPVGLLMQANIPLCLGTDGLSSAPNLDIWEDALWLHRQQHVPLAALVRMLTVNGAHCLKKQHFGTLEVGKSSAFSLLPTEMLACL